MGPFEFTRRADDIRLRGATRRMTLVTIDPRNRALIYRCLYRAHKQSHARWRAPSTSLISDTIIAHNMFHEHRMGVAERATARYAENNGICSVSISEDMRK